MAKNKIIAGDYQGSMVSSMLGTIMVGSMTFDKWGNVQNLLFVI